MLTVEGNAEGADIGRLKRRLSVQLRTREVCRPACDGGGRLNFVWMRVASGGVHRRSGAVPARNVAAAVPGRGRDDLLHLCEVLGGR